jgi:hypothetical protein
MGGTLPPMGSSGEKHKGRDHLPKVGSDPQREMREERMAVEENLGLRPGSVTARVVGAVLVIIAVVAIVSLIVLN